MKETYSKEVEKFIIFCLESYKAEMNIGGEQALHDFEVYDVFSYLDQGFEVLHTQGKQYLVADIKEYIVNKQEQ